MKKRAIVPEELQSQHSDWRMSPGLACGDFLFLTGMTGIDSDGNLSSDPETQIRTAFRKVGLVLAKDGLSYSAIVDMTTYHVGLRDHLELFKSIRSEYVEEPFPSWTAIEVNGFVREGAIIEIKAIASRMPKTN
ncbi:MAG: RidA family protein [Pseudomonadota bacterium]